MNYIENFLGRLNAVLKNSHDVQSGCEHIKKSEMQKGYNLGHRN